MTLFGCDASGDVSDCTEYDNIDGDSRATSYAYFSIENGENSVDLTQGLYVLAVGRGAEVNNLNQFLLQADIDFSNS